MQVISHNPVSGSASRRQRRRSGGERKEEEGGEQGGLSGFKEKAKGE